MKAFLDGAEPLAPGTVQLIELLDTSTALSHFISRSRLLKGRTRIATCTFMAAGADAGADEGAEDDDPFPSPELSFNGGEGTVDVAVDIMRLSRYHLESLVAFR